MDFTTMLMLLKAVSLALMIGNLAPTAPVPPPPAEIVYRAPEQPPVLKACDGIIMAAPQGKE